MKRLHAIVNGRVQGVGFRYFVCEEARRLGVTGWVRNLPSGQVELLAEGEDVALEHLVRLLEKGSRLAWVDEVETRYDTPTGDFTTFTIRH